MYSTIFWITALLLTAPAGVLFAQSTTRVRHISEKAGLASDYITCLLQDRKGFVWIGSVDGLTRYDGHACKVFKLAPDGSPVQGVSSVVTALYEDLQGSLWVATNLGLHRYASETESFVNYALDSVHSGKADPISVYSMFEDAQGSFWITSWNGGLFEMNRESGVLRCFYPYPDSIYQNNTINTSIAFPDALRPGLVWVPFGVNGNWQLHTFNTTERTFHPVDSKALPFGCYIYGVARDFDGLIWFATSVGLRLFNPMRQTFEQPGAMFQKLTQTPIMSVVVDARGRLWVGTQNEGVYVFDKKDGLLAHHTQQKDTSTGLGSNKAVYLMAGRTGEVWVGSADNGLFIVNEMQQRFRHLGSETLIKNVVGEQISTLFEDSRENIWVGHAQGGLYLLNRSSGRLEKAETVYPFLRDLSDDYLFSICETNDGRLWFGTNGRGLMCADLTRKTVQTYRRQAGNTASLCSDYVSCLIKDQKGRLWIGTYGGLNLFDPSGGGFQQYLHQEGDAGSLPNPYVYCVYEDKYGHIWVGTTDGMGVLEPATGTFRQFLKLAPGKSSVVGVSMVSILQDTAGFLWAATESGLYRMRFPDEKNPFSGDPAIRIYTEYDGMPRMAVKGLVEDRRGRLWLSTLKGLTLFRNPRHDDRVPPDFRNYGVSDGLLPNLYKNRAAVALRSGFLAFGGRAGIVLFHPDQFMDDTDRPPVVITVLEKFDAKQPEAPAVPEVGMPYRPEVVLSYSNNIFTIGFTVLDYRGDGTNRFAYRMIGFNDSWVQLGDQRKVTFTNLNPGTYIFEVRGTNSDGVWNDQPATVTIIIRPPWWKTWWAYTFYGLLFVGALFAFVRARLHYLRQRTRQLESAVRISTAKILSQKEQLEQQARELQDIDRLKSRFYTNITHELRTPLTLILGPLESLQKSKSLDIQEASLLKMARHNGQKLNKLIQVILDLSKLEAGKLELHEAPLALAPLLRQMVAQFDSFAGYRDVSLQFHTDMPEDALVMLDAHKLETIVNNLISNALKFTDAGGEVLVSLSGSAGKLTLTVRDTGRGIHPDDLPHVFDRFYQTKHPEIPAEGGAGIGLALCAELVRLFGGRIWVESELGHGSVFFVEWPTRVPPRGARPIQPTGMGGLVVDIRGQIQAPTIQAASDRTQLPRILLVEDNLDLQAYLVHLLSPSYDLVVVGNGEDALTVLDGVDLIISDVLMPRMDGFQLLEQLKTNAVYRQIPIIILTARAEMQDKLRALRIGVDDYLTKPFDEEELLARVRNLITRRNNRLEAVAATVTADATSPAVSEADSKWLAELEIWTRSNLQDENLSVQTMARNFTMSERHLLRRVRELTGMSPQQYIGELRLQKARELLERGAFRTVSEAAYAAGFGNAKAFSRAYQERFGRLPSSYF